MKITIDIPENIYDTIFDDQSLSEEQIAVLQVKILKGEVEDIDTMPLICLRCKKDIPLATKTFHEISYTHYSYCEECLRKGLKVLRMIEKCNDKSATKCHECVNIIKDEILNDK